MRRSRYVPLTLVATACAVLAACDHAQVADPVEQDYVRTPVGLLAACQLNPEVEFSGTFGLLGGTIAGQGVSMFIPPAALLAPTSITVTVPSSPYAEVEIRANGQEHYQFLLPVVIAIDYSGCTAPSGQLKAWHIDTETKTLLQDMGGVDDVVNQRVIFSTMHLSGYAIAN